MEEEEVEITLMNAVINNEVETVSQLLTEDLDINHIYSCSSGFTALFEACDKRNLRMIRLLVEHGADMEIRDRDGETCLREFQYLMTYDMLKYLLRAGIRVNRRSANGETVLHNCHATEFVQLLLKNGAIIKKNEYRLSPITSNAWQNNRKTVQFLDEHIYSGDTPTFGRNSTCTRNPYWNMMEWMDTIDAYKSLGASCFNYNQPLTIQAWSTAIKLCEKSGIDVQRHLSVAPLCTYCMQISAEETDTCLELSKQANAWSAVRLDAREIVTGLELLQRVTKRNEETWISKFHAYLHCPTSPPGRCTRSVVLQSVKKVRRYSVFENTYFVKWQQLQTELHVLYNGMVCMICPNLTPMVDVILSIEPACFVQRRYQQNDLDPHSYYLQWQWLTCHRYTPPRTNYRRSYSACNVCGYTLIQFGGVYHPQSPDYTSLLSDNTTNLVCKKCSLVIQNVGSQPIRMLTQSVYRSGYHTYRTSDTHEPTAVPSEKMEPGNSQITSKTFCPHCGLVSEQHPLLQTFRKYCEAAYGNAREFSNRAEIAELMSNPTALERQVRLITWRLICRKQPLELLYLIVECTPGIPALEDIWVYAFQCLRIMFKLNHTSSALIHRLLKQLMFHIMNGKSVLSIGLNVIIDHLELAVNAIEGSLEMAFYRLDEEYKEMLEFDSNIAMSEIVLQLTTVLLVHYHHKVPFHGTKFKGRCLIDVMTKEYCQIRNIVNDQCPPSKLLDGVMPPANASDNNSDHSLREKHFSPLLMHRFVSQVYRVICLDPRAVGAPTLMQQACVIESSTYLKHFSNCYFELYTVRFLLQLGADPNCVDSNGQTVVGYVLKYRRKDKQRVHCVLAALMEAGAHLDAYKRGDDGADLDQKLCDFLQENSNCLVRNGKLACLAATTLRRNGLTPSHLQIKAVLPEHLLTFLDLH